MLSVLYWQYNLKFVIRSRIYTVYAFGCIPAIHSYCNFSHKKYKGMIYTKYRILQKCNNKFKLNNQLHSCFSITNVNNNGQFAEDKCFS